MVWTGGSAGGLAVYLNLDHVAARVAAVSPKAKVIGLGDAGFFLDHAPFIGAKQPYTESMTCVAVARSLPVALPGSRPPSTSRRATASKPPTQSRGRGGGSATPPVTTIDAATS